MIDTMFVRNYPRFTLHVASVLSAPSRTSLVFISPLIYTTSSPLICTARRFSKKQMRDRPMKPVMHTHISHVEFILTSEVSKRQLWCSFNSSFQSVFHRIYFAPTYTFISGFIVQSCIPCRCFLQLLCVSHQSRHCINVANCPIDPSGTHAV